jgi:hypothetical protein
MEKTINVQEKLQGIVERHSKRVEETGKSHIDTCSAAPSFGWDVDVWNHRHTIMDAFRKRGYTVSSSTNHDVLDTESTNKRHIMTEGYVDMVVEELLKKINNFSKKEKK